MPFFGDKADVFRVREINTSIEIIIFVEANIIKFNKPLLVIINSVLNSHRQALPGCSYNL